LLLAMSMGSMSCEPSVPTSDKLFEKYRKSVVLIRHEYVYKLTLGDEIAYFTDFDEKNGINNFFASKKEALANRIKVSGTGFFADKDGNIITNRHVVHDWDDARTKIAISKLQGKFSSIQSTLLEEKTEKEIELKNAVNPEQMNPLIDEINELTTAFQKIGIMNNLIGSSSPKIEVDSYFLGIALDGTIVASDRDFIPCTRQKISANPEIDLACIQTNGKSLPTGVADKGHQLIPLANQDRASKSKKASQMANKPVFMIGYNRGIEIGQEASSSSTSNGKVGLRVQLMNGTVMQDPDEHKVLHGITCLGGSSGSPILDKSGKLIAINFGGYSGTDGFNYGVLAKHLSEVYTPASQKDDEK
jgi:Trypsin-like peptidase domain